MRLRMAEALGNGKMKSFHNAWGTQPDNVELSKYYLYSYKG